MSACEQSSDFCRELLEMSEDLDQLEPDALAGRMQTAPSVEPPDLSHHLTGAKRKQERRPASTWSVKTRLGTTKITRIGLPVLAAAAAVVLLLKIFVFTPIGIPGQVSARLDMDTEAVDKGYLITQRIRGRAPERTYATPQEAAYAMFRQLLTYSDGELILRPADTVGISQQDHKTLLFRLFGDSVTPIGEARIGVASETVGLLDDAECYLLTLPALSLYKVSEIGDTTDIAQSKVIRSACILLVGTDDKVYRPIGGNCIQIEEP